MKIIITEQNSGKTVLDIVKRQLRISSRMLTKLKKMPTGITVNSEHVTVRRILTEGDVLEISDTDTAEETNRYLIPVSGTLDIVYEDDYMTAVNKPPEMPTHTSRNHDEDTLANIFAYRNSETENYVFRPVNRLDRNTSGLVLIAKNHYAASRLSDMIQNGMIKKKYIAVLQGEISENEREGTIVNFISRAGASIITRVQSDEYTEGADRAVTEYSCICVKNGLSVVSACPRTGRTHQLRVHFAGLGHSILGDDLYGAPSDIISRQALHAHTLEFSHPVTGDRVAITARIPRDINEILEANEITL